MSVSLRKIDGVESVTVSLNEGIARITLDPGNTLGLGRIRALIERNGFTPRQAAITAEAEVVGPSDRPRLRIRGVDETYGITGSPAAGEASIPRAGAAVFVKGVIPAPEDDRAPSIRVVSIRPSTGR